MSTSHDLDQQFHENLRVLAGCIPAPGAPSADVRVRCRSAFESAGVTRAHRFPFLRKPSILSTLGVAASIVLILGLFFPWNGGPKVEAATILAKLNEQCQEPRLIEVTMDSISVDNIVLDAHLQIAKAGAAGDLHVIVGDGEVAIEVDLSLAISRQDSWVLIRKLSVPNPDVQPLLTLLFPSGSETLLTLPSEFAHDELDVDPGDAPFELGAASRFIETLAGLVREQPESGATVTDQGDGSLLLTMPIADARTLEEFLQLASQAVELYRENGSSIQVEFDSSGSIDEGSDLFGSTLEIVYDPGLELVRSFAITDFGENEGTLSVSFKDEDLDLDLLDSSRVVGPHTRTLDLTGLKSMVEMFGHVEDDDE